MGLSRYLNINLFNLHYIPICSASNPTKIYRPSFEAIIINCIIYSCSIYNICPVFFLSKHINVLLVNMVYRNLHTRSKIFSFPVYGPGIRRGSSHVCENMTHFLGFRRGNLRPALRIFFVFSRAENAVGNVKWKLKNWKKGSRVEARLVMLYRPVGYYLRCRDNLSLCFDII